MADTAAPIAGIGDNSGVKLEVAAGVEFFEDLCKRLAAGSVDTDNEETYEDLRNQERTLRKEIEAAHEEAKRPHLEAGRAVDRQYKPLLTRLETALKAPAELLRTFRVEKDRKRREELARAEVEAAAARAVAAEAEAKAAAPDTDPFERFDANRAVEHAQTQVVESARTASTIAATGVGINGRKGLKMVKGVEITDAGLCAAHFAKHPDVLEALRKAANGAQRTAKWSLEIPGTKITETPELA